MRLGPALAVVFALAIVAPAGAATIPPPDADPFYAQPAAAVLAAQPPGTVLRSREVTVNGLGIPLPARSWQVFYRSNDTHSNPIGAVATIVVPSAPYLGGPRPLVSYQMAIDSLGTQCNPSYTLRTGTQKETISVAGLVAAGYAVVVPDFEGPRMAYTAGPLAARTTLDGIRAALRFAPDGLGARTPVGMWGYSGGGQATAWAAEQQPVYAPELKLAAVAEGGVPPDIEQVARQIDGGPFFGVYFAGVVGSAREYPEYDIDPLLNDRGKALKREIGTQCAETLVTGYPFQHMSDYTTVPDFLAQPDVQAVIEDNRLGKVKPAAPIYIYHSVLDELIPVAGPDALVASYCAQGARVFYRRDVLGEHVAYAFTGAPGALAYLAARFAGVPPATNCPSG